MFYVDDEDFRQSGAQISPQWPKLQGNALGGSRHEVQGDTPGGSRQARATGEYFGWVQAGGAGRYCGWVQARGVGRYCGWVQAWVQGSTPGGSHPGRVSDGTDAASALQLSLQEALLPVGASAGTMASCAPASSHQRLLRPGLLGL